MRKVRCRMRHLPYGKKLIFFFFCLLPLSLHGQAIGSLFDYLSKTIEHQDTSINNELSQKINTLLSEYRQHPHDTLLLKAASHTASFFMKNGQWKKAIDIYLKSIEYLKPQIDFELERSDHLSENSTLLAGFIHLEIALGVAYEESGLRYMSMDVYREALEYSKKLNKENEKAMLFNNMANIYWKLNELEKAEALWDSALRINTRLDNHPELARNYLNLAGLAYIRKQENQVLDYLFLAQKLVDRENDTYMYYNIRFNTASTYAHMQEYGLAIKSFREVVQHYEQEKNFSFLTMPYLALSSAFAQMNEPDSALFYAQKAYMNGKNSADLPTYIQAIDRLSKELHARGRTEEAYELMQEHCRLNDSLSIADTRKQLDIMEDAYETERRIRQNDMVIQSLEIKNLAFQKQSLFLILVIFLVIGVSLVLFLKYRSTLKIKAEQDKFIQYQSQQHQKEKVNLEKREQDLLDSLELKNKELTTNVLRLIKNNEFAIGIGKELQQLLLELNPREQSKKERIKQLMVRLRNLQNEGTYAEFHYYFEQVHQSFYENLQKQFPNLSYRDVRLCAFLRLGLSTKEIAAISFKTPRSVEASRNRLRKRMNIAPQENLIEFLSQF